MRTRIKVMDLTLRQWDHLQDNLRPSYNMADGVVRVCVEFDRQSVVNELPPWHVEMPVRAFVALMTQLQRIEVHGQIEEGVAELPPLPPKWSASLTPVEARANHPSRAGSLAASAENLATGPTCDHGAVVVNERPSVFEGAEPVRDYADGCQSCGPYQSLDT